jgi:hypothetical protein
LPEQDLNRRVASLFDNGVALDRAQLAQWANWIVNAKSAKHRRERVALMEKAVIDAQVARSKQPGIPKDKEVDAMFDLLEQGKIEQKVAGKTSDTFAPKTHPTKQDIAMNVDEVLAVGEAPIPAGAKASDFNAVGGLPPGNPKLTAKDRRDRALSVKDRDTKDQITNQKTKWNWRQKDVTERAPPGQPVSIDMRGKSNNEFGAFFGRRWSEIKEVLVLHERILAKMKGKDRRRGGDLKAEYNAAFWDDVKNRRSPEGKIIMDAIERGGFGLIQAKSGHWVYRQLTAKELRARGFRYVEGQGWIK